MAEEIQEDDLKKWEESQREIMTTGYAKYEKYFAWTRDEIVKPALEPSPTQILQLPRWEASRWCADLLRNPDYVPRLEIVMALTLRGVDDFSAFSLRFSQSKLDKYYEEIGFIETSLDEEVTQKQKEAALSYKNTLSLAKNHSSYSRGLVVSGVENHPDFVDGLRDFDDYDSILSLSREYSRRLAGTEAGARMAEWMLNNLPLLVAYADPEQQISLLYQMVEAAGKPADYNSGFYRGLGKFIVSAREVFGFYGFEDVQQDDYLLHYDLPNGGEIVMDGYSHSDAMRVIFGFGNERSDTVDGLIVASSKEDTDFQDKVLSTIFGERGPAEVLRYMREVINDDSLNSNDRSSVNRLFLRFYEGVVELEGDVVAPQDVVDFYSRVVDNESFMTESREGSTRVHFLKTLFEKEGIKNQLVVDLAAGNGWLTARLKELGYNVIGVDISSDLVGRARNRYPDNKYYVAPWDDLKDVENIEKTEVFIVNGRSINHVQQFPGLHALMSEIDGAKMIVFDGANPLSGAQKDRLAAFRSSLENFGFSRQWLENYMWQGVGSHDGITLGDRWYPPRGWWENMMGMYGYNTEVFVEPNYDGKGTENLVVVSRREEDSEKKLQLIQQSENYFKKLMSMQPVNKNRYSIRYWR